MGKDKRKKPSTQLWVPWQNNSHGLKNTILVRYDMNIHERWLMIFSLNRVWKGNTNKSEFLRQSYTFKLESGKYYLEDTSEVT